MNYIGWVANAFLIVGMLLVGEKLAIGFLFTIIGEILWVIKCVKLKQTDMWFICLLFTFVAAYNLWKWCQ